jgi:hypothetical protein
MQQGGGHVLLTQSILDVSTSSLLSETGFCGFAVPVQEHSTTAA